MNRAEMVRLRRMEFSNDNGMRSTVTPSQEQLREEIRRQTEEFLARGGKIDVLGIDDYDRNPWVDQRDRARQDYKRRIGKCT